MRVLLTAVVLTAMVICDGCAGRRGGGWTDFWDAGPWWQATQVHGIARRAREWEDQGEFQLALEHWRLAARIASDPTGARNEIDRLTTRIDLAVGQHHRKGLEALRNHDRVAARNHFLAALRLNPAFQPALRQIRARYGTFPLSVYPVAAGDTPKTVAQKVFGDSDKAFLVAWFNQLSVDGELSPGTLLLLPKPEKAPGPTTPAAAPVDRLTEARAQLAEGALDAALALARQADPTDPNAQAMIHTIQLRQATEQIDAHQLETAEEILAAVPDTVTGKSAIREKLQSAREQRQFDLVLAAARDQFAQGRYAQSLALAEQLRPQAPAHHEIHRLAVESRYRLALATVDSGRYLEARDVLATAEDAHAPSAALKATVRTRLVQMGQMHYRIGVKHFINEHLEAAIAEWEKALVCDPDHAKARENIANARRLLKKVQTMP